MTEYQDRIHTQRAVLLRWLRANGLEPMNMPVDATVLVKEAEKLIVTEVYLTDSEGKHVLAGDGVVRIEKTVPLQISFEAVENSGDWDRYKSKPEFPGNIAESEKPE